jgi:hypothetical protein
LCLRFKVYILVCRSKDVLAGTFLAASAFSMLYETKCMLYMRRDIPYSMAIKAYVDTILRTYLLQRSNIEFQ